MWKKLKSALNPSKPPELTSLFPAANPGQWTDYEKALYAPPVSFAAQFPDVPPPEPPTFPEIIAARWVAGDIYAEKMPEIAADLLEAGFDTPSTCRLAGEMHAACRADIEELVLKILNELGVQIPASETEAKMLATRQIAREVIAGLKNPWKGSTELERIWGHDIWDHKHLADIAQLLDEPHWDAGYGRPLAALTPELVENLAQLGARTAREKRMRGFGALQGKGWIAYDFNGPLPDDLQALFEGRDEPEW